MEKVYRGRYGIDEWFLNEQENITAAKAYGCDASKALMKKYNSIESKLRKEAQRRVDETNGNFDTILESLYNNLVYFELYEVDSNKFPNETIMYCKFHDGHRKFASEFCKQII